MRLSQIQTGLSTYKTTQRFTIAWEPAGDYTAQKRAYFCINKSKLQPAF